MTDALDRQEAPAFAGAPGAIAMLQATPIVFIVDDDISVRESLEALLQVAGWEPKAFASAQEFLNHPHALAPRCLLLDVNLPDLNGLELQERLAQDGFDLPIIFLTGYGDIPTSVRAMKAGAVEFLTKPFDEATLLSAVERAIQVSHNTLGRQAELQRLLDRYASLSPRERDVMALVVSGLLNKQVGGRLGISEITVKAHRGQVMKKMASNSLADLVRMADRLGVSPSRL